MRTITTTITTTEKTLFLGLLYFIQGFPYGFQDKLIPLLLIVKGHSPSTIGLIRLLLLPWLAKALFAPLIDMTLTITKWISISLIGLMCLSLFNTLWPDSTVHSDNGEISYQFITTLFLLNFFSAFQDIGVDAIAVDIYTNHEDILSGNAGQVVGYKLGAFFGSGILFWIYSLFEWDGLFAVLTLIYSFVLFVFNSYSDCFLLNENIDDRGSEKSISIGKENANKQRERRQNSSKLRHWFINAKYVIFETNHSNQQQHHDCLSTTTMAFDVLLYVFLYKLGESGTMVAYPFFLSGCGVSSHQIAFWNGTFGIICSMFGSVMASRFSVRILSKLIKFRLLPLFLQLVVITVIYFDLINFSPSFNLVYCVSILSMLLLHFIGGLVTTMTFTLMMMACQRMPKSFRATRYTLMSTTEVLGKLILSSISGLIVDSIGFVGAQLLFFVLSILPCYYLRESLLVKITVSP